MTSDVLSQPNATAPDASSATTTKNAKYFRTALGDLTPNNINQLKRINTVLFPIRYDDKFYQDALLAEEYAKIGVF
jgi:hypothetical protein